ncbi:uncharacterized protein N7483_012417 [Penicillium malachiteum]|uniref:uncharacterized protein n=1 Tax=Penicillium malachiteum TaxID=1324776 RepID=UPI0025472704|nr:uncharacterized protein N7483_012417 [Penicillium malachiteum]KAJ5715236.1 hypothetical protein N7483_012417 [Penicillium malachiteum]
MTDKGRRQQPGYACEECRRRKARCDRARPRCGFCTEIGAQATHPVEIETGELTEADLDIICPPSSGIGMCYTSSAALEPAPLSLSSWADWTGSWHPEELSSQIDVCNSGLQRKPSNIVLEDHNQLNLHKFESMSNSVNIMMGTTVTDHIRADLDQVYFDRVHPALPIIYPQTFLSWADQENPGAARTCLRSAMRTIAAAMSAPGCRFCNELYAETYRLLEDHKMTFNHDEIIPIEHIQAWLLVAFYELLRVNEHQAMLTAGRCFRLVLMARLFEIDASKPDEFSFQVSQITLVKEQSFKESFSVVEEQRRLFWLAFCLDRFLCSRNDYPLTLSEEMICTRLPSPEANFQNNQHIRTSFLEEAMSVSSVSQKGLPLSPFAEIIILMTLHGRCMAHRRFCDTKRQPVNMNGDDFWTRQKRLVAAVEQRMQILSTTLPIHADSSPLILLSHTLVHSAIIKLGHIAENACGGSSWRTVEQPGTTAVHERRAAAAAREMVRLAKQVPSFSCFKGHPFLPDPLACAADYLMNRVGNLSPSNEVGVQHILRLLRDMQGINSLARVYFDR